MIQGGKLKLRPIMWDVLSGDFDTKIKPENCYLNVIKNSEPGSIIVFHDSQKALPTLQYALPKVLRYFSEKGFQFKTLQGAL
jgi:peptidoglycan/xylan/chitin deacetylase (PgdA/CDA1 family)